MNRYYMQFVTTLIFHQLNTSYISGKTRVLFAGLPLDLKRIMELDFLKDWGSKSQKFGPERTKCKFWDHLTENTFFKFLLKLYIIK